MSVVFSGSFSGTFTSAGLDKFIPLPSGVDTMFVLNETVAYAAGAGTGAQFYWARGDAQGRGTIYTKTAVTNALAIGQIAAASGFYLQDTSLQIPGAFTALTGITNANPPVVNTANTQGLPVTAVVGANNPAGVVRILSTVGAQQLGGLDFSVGNVVNNTSFELLYMSAIVSANPGAGAYRVIPFDPIFYPRHRTITKISAQAVTGYAIVTLSVTHGYTVGQEVRFTIPNVTALAFGMTELNGLQGSIVQVGVADADGMTNTIVVDIDVSGFSAFAFPLTADVPFTPAQITPIGENTATALNANTNILGDATVNQAQFGMLLRAGANSPAGVANDVIKWIAYKSFNQ